MHARRGHHVTLVSPFKLKDPVNHTHIDLSADFPSLAGQFKFEYASEHLGNAGAFEAMRSISNFAGPEFCRKVLSHPKLQDIYSGKHKFDVIFTSIFHSDCLLAIGYKLKVRIQLALLRGRISKIVLGTTCVPSSLAIC